MKTGRDINGIVSAKWPAATTNKIQSQKINSKANKSELFEQLQDILITATNLIYTQPTNLKNRNLVDLLLLRVNGALSGLIDKKSEKLLTSIINDTTILINNIKIKKNTTYNISDITTIINDNIAITNNNQNNDTIDINNSNNIDSKKEISKKQDVSLIRIDKKSFAKYDKFYKKINNAINILNSHIITMSTTILSEFENNNKKAREENFSNEFISRPKNRYLTKLNISVFNNNIHFIKKLTSENDELFKKVNDLLISLNNERFIPISENIDKIKKLIKPESFIQKLAKKLLSYSKKYINKFTKSKNKYLTKFFTGINSVITRVEKFLTKLKRAVMKIYKVTRKFLKATFSLIRKVFKALISPLVFVFKQTLRGILFLIKMTLKGIWFAIKFIITVVWKLLTFIGRYIGKLIGKILDVIRSVIRKVLERIKGIFGKIGKRIKSIIQKFKQKIINALRKIKDKVLKVLKKIKDKIVKVFKKIVNKVKEVVKKIVKKIVEKVKKIAVKIARKITQRLGKKAAKKVATKVGKKLGVKLLMKLIVKPLMKFLAKLGVKIAATSALNLIPGIGTIIQVGLILYDIIDWFFTFKELYDEFDKNPGMWDMIKEMVVNWVKEKAGKLLDKMMEWGKKIFNAIIDGIKTALAAYGKLLEALACAVLHPIDTSKVVKEWIAHRSDMNNMRQDEYKKWRLLTHDEQLDYIYKNFRRQKEEVFSNIKKSSQLDDKIMHELHKRSGWLGGDYDSGKVFSLLGDKKLALWWITHSSATMGIPATERAFDTLEELVRTEEERQARIKQELEDFKKYLDLSKKQLDIDELNKILDKNKQKAEQLVKDTKDFSEYLKTEFESSHEEIMKYVDEDTLEIDDGLSSIDIGDIDDDIPEDDSEKYNAVIMTR